MSELRIEGVETGARQPIETRVLWGVTVAVDTNPPASNGEVTAPDGKACVIRLFANAPVWVAIGAAPDPSAEPRVYLPASTPRWLHLGEGQRISFKDANLASP